MKKKYKILFLIIGIAGFVFLLLSSEPEKEDWQKLITPWVLLVLLAMLLLWAVIYMLHARTMRRVIGSDSAELRPLELYRICISGFALNDVTPLGMVGGEPYRIMALKRYLGIERATAATLTFSVLYIVGHVLLWLTGIILYMLLGCPGESFTTALLMLVMLLLITVSCMFFSARSRGIIVPLLGVLGKLPLLKRPAASFLEKNRSLLEEIDADYSAFRKVPDRFYRAVLCEYGARILEAVEYFTIFRFLGEPVTIAGAILILSMASLVGNLIFIIPMQTGAREGGMALAIDWLGLDPATGMIGGLLYRIRSIACILIGLLLILFRPSEDGSREAGTAP